MYLQIPKYDNQEKVNSGRNLLTAVLSLEDGSSLVVPSRRQNHVIIFHHFINNGLDLHMNHTGGILTLLSHHRDQLCVPFKLFS